ncbi:Domain of unknown function DUF4485 [Cinara cedri]|uniref:DUF4485 domain-containing protein n=1 Tax=Cinara cedri TaxID=506608 RepID=A0A5E4MF83_9HEMI|nr:Domain of unknown function DUF4485 [Cinara cedri]
MDTVENCIEEITNSLHKIEDPGQLQNVHRWVIKLTTGEPNGLKEDYLRLLEYTIKSGDLREPFDSPPKEGRLPGLSELVRRPSSPSPCSPEERNRSALSAGGCGLPDYVKDCTAKDRTGPEPCPELVGIIEQTNCEIASLQRFMADVQRYTCDGGKLMEQVCGQMMDDYLQAAEAVFDDRAQKLSDSLAKEQVALLLRYRNEKQRMISRAQILLDYVRELMPKFIHSEYIVEPEAYMKRLIMEKKNAILAKNTDGDDKNSTTSAEQADSSATDIEHKKLLSALVWLRSEEDRSECENLALVERFESIVVAIDAASRRRTANECQAKTQRSELRCELDSLRKKSAMQVAQIDDYVDKISAEKTESRPLC